MNALKVLIFFQTGNVVQINNESEYVKFIRVMTNLGRKGLLPSRKYSYEEMIRLYNLPHNRSKHPNWDGKTLYAEFQPDKESIGFYPYTPDVYDWYGVEPLSVNDIA